MDRPSSSASVRVDVQVNVSLVVNPVEGEIEVPERIGLLFVMDTEDWVVAVSPAMSVAVTVQVIVSVGDAVNEDKVTDVLLPIAVVVKLFFHS